MVLTYFAGIFWSWIAPLYVPAVPLSAGLDRLDSIEEEDGC